MVWNLLFLFLNKKFKNLRKKYLKYFLIFLHSYRYRFSRMSLKTGSKGEKKPKRWSFKEKQNQFYGENILVKKDS